jgi:hypothetical protein
MMQLTPPSGFSLNWKVTAARQGKLSHQELKVSDRDRLNLEH